MTRENTNGHYSIALFFSVDKQLKIEFFLEESCFNRYLGSSIAKVSILLILRFRTLKKLFCNFFFAFEYFLRSEEVHNTTIYLKSSVCSISMIFKNDKCRLLIYEVIK